MGTTRSAFIVGLKEHDPASWDQFVETYHPFLRTLIRRQGVEERDAGDILHDIFVRVYQVIPRFEYQRSKGSFGGWLKSVTVNAITDWRRKHSRKEAVLFDESNVIQKKRSTSESMIMERLHLFEEAITVVRQRTRRKTWACFEEHALNGRAAVGVAEELAVSVNVVYVNTSRVMSQLRTYCLEKHKS